MKENTGIWLTVICFSVLIGLLVYKLYPVTTRTQYGISIDIEKLIRDADEKRREKLLNELGGFKYTWDFRQPDSSSTFPHPKWDERWDFSEELVMPAPVIKYQDGSEENCWFNIKTGEPEFFSEAPPAERIREFIPQDQASQNLYEEYIKQGKEPVAAARSVLSDKFFEGLEKE